MYIYTGTLDTSKFNVVFDGNNVLAATTFNKPLPRLKRLEDEVLLQLGVV